MTNGNEPAFVNNGATKGLTKREYFAAMRSPSKGDRAISFHLARLIMNSEPPSDPLENMLWWILAQEKHSVLHADALIEALNKQ